MNWLISYRTARIILVTWSRTNLIIGLIFPVGKKGQLGKKILFNLLQVLRFSFYQITNMYNVSHTDGIKYLGRVKYNVTSAIMFIDMASLAH